MTTPTDRPNLDDEQSDRPNLDRLRELDKAATSAPWNVVNWVDHASDGEPRIVGNHGTAFVAEAYRMDNPNAALIAAYRNATPALVAALTDVLDMADEWSALSWLPEFPTYEDFAKASPAQRTLWEAAENLRDAIHAHITETSAPASRRPIREQPLPVWPTHPRHRDDLPDLRRDLAREPDQDR